MRAEFQAAEKSFDRAPIVVAAVKTANTGLLAATPPSLNPIYILDLVAL